MPEYNIDTFTINVNNVSKTHEFVQYTDPSIPWGITASYIYKSDNMYFNNIENRNDLVIENKTDNIIFKTKPSYRTIVENSLDVSRINVKNLDGTEISIYNDALGINGPKRIYIDGNLFVNGNINLNASGSIVQSTSFSNTILSDPTIVGGTSLSTTLNNCSINSCTLSGGVINKMTLNNCFLDTTTVKGNITLNPNINITGSSSNSIDACTLNNNKINNFTLENGEIKNATIDAMSTIAGGTITNANINNANITSGSINSSNIIGGSITNTVFVDGSINSSRLYGGTIRNAVFTDNSINTCTLSGGTLSYVYINKSILADNSINNCTLSGGTIKKYILNDCSINSFTLSGGTLSYVYISKTLFDDSSINNCTLSGGTIKKYIINDSSINSFTLSGGTIIATNIGCNDSGTPNIPKRGTFTNINIVGTNNVNNLAISSSGNIDTNGIINVSNKVITSAIDVSGLLDISRGTIRANTINGTAVTINCNASSTQSVVAVTTGTNSPTNGIIINNVKVATTKHIEMAIPYGLIMAYYHVQGSGRPLPPYGWLICDGSNNLTPDLRGRFILGVNTQAATNTKSTFLANSTGGAERVILSEAEMPYHTHGAFTYQFGYINRGNYGSNTGVVNSTGQHPYDVPKGSNHSHENMPPYLSLYYIMKVDVYDFTYING